MNPLLSINARYKTLCLNHFERTSPGKRLYMLKNQHAGARCFFIGNGPSLQAKDLTTLHEHNEITFAFNRIYNIFDQTPWRPSYYISQDDKMLSGCVETVNRTELGKKFIPIQMKWYYGLDVPGAACFNMQNMTKRQLENPSDYPFSDDIPHGIYGASTGMYTAAQLAAYMGFREIYFIGVDHHFRISQNNAGEIVVDDKVQDYFSEQYNQDKDQLYIPNTEKSTLTYVAMKQHCGRRGISVCNATRGGKLEVFPRVDFDSLFDK